MLNYYLLCQKSPLHRGSRSSRWCLVPLPGVNGNIFWEVVENGYLDITVVWHESGNLAKFDIFNLDSFRFVISPVRFLTIGKLDFPQVRERICPIMAAVRKWEVQTELSGLPNHLQLTPRDGWISSLETFRCNIRTHLICFLQYHVQNYSEF